MTTPRARRWSLVLALATLGTALPPIAPAAEYEVVFDGPLTQGSFYTTSTTSQGRYYTYNNGRRFTEVPPGTDFNRTPTNLYSDLTHPVHAVQGVPNKLNTFGVTLTASEGALNGTKLVGTAKQFFNIAGTFKILPTGTAPNTGSVKVFMQGLIDGQVGTKTKSLADAPKATFGASIMVEKVGTATASRGLDGSTTTTVGVETQFSKDPAAKASASDSVQKLPETGSGASNFGSVAMLPINTTLVWQFTMNLEAQNSENFLGGNSAAWAWLTKQFVVIAPLDNTRVAAADPFEGPAGQLKLRSASLTAYSPGTGLTMSHPLTTNGVVQAESIVNDDGTFGPAQSSDYTNFRPEAEFVHDNNDFRATDGLLASLLEYGSILRTATNPDGSVAFSDTTLTFRSSLGQPLAHATLQNILADPADGTFDGLISNFTYDTLLPGASELADRLFAFGGTIDLDPQIISLTSGFLSSGLTEAPFSVTITALPEPSLLSLLITTAAAAHRPRRRPAHY